MKEILTPRAKIEDRLPEVIKFGEGLKNDGFKSVSILGYCWGECLNWKATCSGVQPPRPLVVRPSTEPVAESITDA